MLNSCSNNFNFKKPSFGSFKENMRVGEKALKHFKSEYPYLRSSSYVQMKYYEHEQNPNFKFLLGRLKNLAMTYEFGVSINRRLARLESSVTKRYLAFKSGFYNRKYANCGEEAFVLAHDFKQWKSKPEYVCMKFIDKTNKQKKRDHAFLLIGAKENAKAGDIKSWGDEAVVVDPWFNHVMKAKDAVELYQDKFLFKPNEEYLEFIKKKDI